MATNQFTESQPDAPHGVLKAAWWCAALSALTWLGVAFYEQIQVIYHHYWVRVAAAYITFGTALAGVFLSTLYLGFTVRRSIKGLQAVLVFLATAILSCFSFIALIFV